MAPLTILLISGEYPPDVGGVGDYTRQLGRALIRRGHLVSVMCNHAVAVQEPDEPAVIALDPARRGRWNWRMWRRVERSVAATEAQIVHIQYQTGAYNLRPAINLLPWRLHKNADRPRIVVTAHDLRLPYLFPKADRVRHWLTARLFADADALIVTNAEDRARVQGHAPADRQLFSPNEPIRTPLHEIPIGSNIAPQPPHAYDRAAWRSSLNIAPADVLIAYFGLLSRTKGVLPLLDALADLSPRFKLLIVGGAAPQPDDQRYAADVQAVIAARNLHDRVTITGPCPAPTVSAHLLAADLLALPFSDGASYRRGSLLAALAHGVPTITTPPAQPLEPPLRDREHVFFVQPDPANIRAAIEQLAADQPLRDRLAQGGRALAEQFAWPAIAALHENVYHTLLKNAARSLHAEP